eukprot:NODE_8048_length_716_cov_19.956155_g7430_i0.p1 GENE.NODE_8048_length_716_cov_19.956155_g7430_i0~~NODE_8048_length_716_cov_19.956155_g7430_i0.p1  ORF type:complete len:183 (+),score=43.94 NODE_8048_length_716_cov_19.956155_g7430_i0:92-640(+)
MREKDLESSLKIAENVNNSIFGNTSNQKHKSSIMPVHLSLFTAVGEPAIEIRYGKKKHDWGPQFQTTPWSEYCLNLKVEDEAKRPVYSSFSRDGVFRPQDAKCMIGLYPNGKLRKFEDSIFWRARERERVAREQAEKERKAEEERIRIENEERIRKEREREEKEKEEKSRKGKKPPSRSKEL